MSAEQWTPSTHPTPQLSDGDTMTDEDEDEVLDSDKESTVDSGQESESSDEDDTDDDDDPQSEDEIEEMNAEENLNGHSFQISLRAFGANFNKDLRSCLSGAADFNGNPCYFEKLPSAPNPCLNIDGLGSIGVPLSPNDAKAISDFVGALKAPESRTEAGNSWAIDAERVGFNNPQWTKFLERTVAERVWNGLGVAPDCAPVKCVLEKLVLVGPGTSNPLEQWYENSLPLLQYQFTQPGKPNSEKDDAPSVNIMVQLPSNHVGGQVHVSHPSQSQTHDINIAEHPFVTSILASYTSADLSFAPITEGYRIALVYRLTSVRPNVGLDLPVEPLMALQLRCIFQTWLKGTCTSTPARRHFVYVLDQQRPPIPQGQPLNHSLLEPRDQEIVSCLCSVAKDFGYAIFSGRLKYEIPDDPPEDDDSDCHSDLQEDPEKPTRIFEDIADSDNVIINGSYQSLKRGDIFPLGFLANLPRRSHSYKPECRTDNCRGIDACRKAVLIIPQDKEKRIFARADLEYWLSRLKAYDRPEPFDPKKIALILSKLSPDHDANSDRDLKVYLMKFAVKWEDLNLWEKAAQKLGGAVDQYDFEDLVEAWKVFSFQRLIPILNEMLLNTSSSEHRLNFLDRIESQALAIGQQNVQAWVTEQYTSTLVKVCSDEDTNQVSDVITIGRRRGAGFLKQILIPHLTTHPACVEFTEYLYFMLPHPGAQIPNSSLPNPTTGESETTAFEVADEILDIALKQPKHKFYGISSLRRLLPDDHEIFKHLRCAIELYIYIDLIEECTLPLRLFLHTGSSYESFVGLYDQLLIEITGWINDAKRCSITTAPFKDFFAMVIGLRMEHLLNSPRPNFDASIPTFGCGLCDYCQCIDQYLHNPDETEFYHRIVAKDREHLWRFLEGLSKSGRVQYDFGPSREHKGRQSLTLKKYTMEGWQSRVNSAKEYLRRIGPDDEIAKIMGDEYPKIQESMQGIRPYVASYRFQLALGDINKKTLGFPPDDSTTGGPAPKALLRDKQEPTIKSALYMLREKRRLALAAGDEGSSKKARTE